jgi:hypothetical protein
LPTNKRYRHSEKIVEQVDLYRLAAFSWVCPSVSEQSIRIEYSLADIFHIAAARQSISASLFLVTIKSRAAGQSTPVTLTAFITGRVALFGLRLHYMSSGGQLK